ncbi:MAG: hypothetical protein KIT31_22550, partial [Deltaproteobacteria bacterium]|nr:hypothetical protein [Deltaproteobacteria bacterium]
TPLDLEVELHEEVVLDGWEAGPSAPSEHRPERTIVPIRVPGLALDAIISTGPDGAELGEALARMAKKNAVRPPLYGLVHYELGTLVFQPLSTIGDHGPDHLMISRGKIDLASLMKTLDFST